MTIEVKETFSHASGCYAAGNVHTVEDGLGREVVAAGLAVEIVAKPTPAPKPKTPKAEGK